MKKILYLLPILLFFANSYSQDQYKLTVAKDTLSFVKTRYSARQDSARIADSISAHRTALASKVDRSTSNTYTVGAKQIFGASATSAGINWAGTTVNPSSLVAGDLWYRSDENKFRYYDGTTTRAFVTEQLTQTLLNKTLSNGTVISDTVLKTSGLPHEIFVSNVPLKDSGTTSEVTLASFTMPAFTMGTNGHFEVIIMASTNINNANAKTVRMRWNTTNVSQTALTSTISFQSFWHLFNRNSQTSQLTGTLGSGVGTGFATSSGTLAPFTINTGADVAVTFTAQLATATGEYIQIESIKVVAWY